MIKVAIAGARGLANIMGFQDMEGVEVAALCDINESLLERESKKWHIPHTYRVFEDMLMSDIDAVVISTPMQLHVPQAMLALRAGKHVMSEVTAGVTLEELYWLVEEVERSGKVYMMAENCCYTPENQQILAMVKAGLFGDVYYGEGEYLHNVVGLTQYPDGSPSWRSWWQLGQRGLFYPTHSLGPVMKWFGGDRIECLTAMGSGWHTHPELRQEDTSVALLQMKSGKLIRLRVDCVSNRPHALMNCQLQGTKGVYEAPRIPGVGHMVSFYQGEDPEKMVWRPLSDFEAYMPERYRNASEAVKNSSHWGSDYFIVEDFIEAVRGNRPPAVDVYEACEWTAVGLLSAISVANRGRTMTMPDFRAKAYRDQKLTLEE